MAKDKIKEEELEEVVIPEEIPVVPSEEIKEIKIEPEKKTGQVIVDEAKQV